MVTRIAEPQKAGDLLVAGGVAGETSRNLCLTRRLVSLSAVTRIPSSET